MTVFVDTSALYAILAGDDPHHAEASTAFAWLLEHDSLVTTNYVVVEAVQLVRRRLGATAVADLLDRLLSSIGTLWIDESSHRAAVEALRAAGGKASLVDHASFVALRGAGITHVLAFDRDFDHEGFAPPEINRSPDRHQLSDEPAGYGSDSVELLVGVAEIAARSGHSANTVQSWRRRHASFPAPAADLASGPVWHWASVAAWIDARRQGPGTRLALTVEG
jgi:predicted nucleic acid-binding protein